MNNAEWVIENKPWIFDSFTCSECVKSYDGKHCPLSADEFDKVVCAKGHTAWLMRPHESSLEPPQTGDCEKDECEPAESENAAPTDTDSRERLRDDAVDWLKDHFACSTQIMSELDVWLDRQAAITERERDRHWMEIVGANANANLELKRQIDELQKRNCPGYEAETHRCRWHDADFELNTTKLNDLKRENADLKKRIEKLLACLVNDFGIRASWDGLRKVWLTEQIHAENAAETPDFAENPQKTPEQRREIVAKDGKPIRIGETLTGEDGIAWTVKGFNRESKYPVIGASCLETRDLKPEWLTHKFNEQHICDTCRFYTHVSDGTGDCHRWPREFVKDPDDWCGEWSE